MNWKFSVNNKEKKPDAVVIIGEISVGSEKVEISWLEPFNLIKENIQVLYVKGNHESLYGKKEILEEIYKKKK